jgi:hypothetical protein
MTDTQSKTRYIELPPQDFAALGVDQLAYVKRIARDGELRFEIHAADGTAVALLDSWEVASAAVIQNGMVPVSVH